MSTRRMGAFGDSYYVLLNRDEEIASFHVDRFDEVIVDGVFRELPRWTGDLGAFIVNRKAPKHRENIEELLKESGCDTIKGFLDVSHALSLVDCFWVRAVGSDACWEDVSLYTHPFNEVIAKAAFEGGLCGRELSAISPEYVTDGSFAKCWIREDEIIKLLKRGSSGAESVGLEPYSEYYACQVIERFTDDFVRYDLQSAWGRVCSTCDAFTSEQVGFLPFAAVEAGNSTAQSVVKCYENVCGAKDFAKMMFIVDAVILNEDRHKNNFGFLVDNEKQEIVSPAPLFDHNLSLLPYGEEEDFERIDDFLAQKGPKLGRDWLSTAASLLDAKTRKILADLRDFKFERHGKYNLPEWRLEALEKLIRKNVQRIFRLLIGGDALGNVDRFWSGIKIECETSFGFSIEELVDVIKELSNTADRTFSISIRPVLFYEICFMLEFEKSDVFEEIDKDYINSLILIINRGTGITRFSYSCSYFNNDKIHVNHRGVVKCVAA